MQDISERTVLIVDDEEAIRDLLTATISAEYRTVQAVDGHEALNCALTEHPDLILLDVMMSGIDGYEVCRQLKLEESTKDIPVIFVTGRNGDEDETSGLSCGAVDYIKKPIKPSIVNARVRNQLELKQAREELRYRKENLEQTVTERTKELQRTKDTIVNSLATLAEYRDSETGGHIHRTQRYMKALAEAMAEYPQFKDQLDKNKIELLVKSAPLHDIGKVAVPDHILLKPGRLTAEEFEEIKKHTVYGYEALSRSCKDSTPQPFLEIGKEIAYTHHEKWNGTGYPLGLANHNIPLSGRMMALVDVYDALISKRIYKSAFSFSQAVDVIENDNGNHFDPAIVEGFQEVKDKFREIGFEYADFEEESNALAV